VVHWNERGMCRAVGMLSEDVEKFQSLNRYGAQWINIVLNGIERLVTKKKLEAGILLRCHKGEML
jgi:hypothetical protein